MFSPSILTLLEVTSRSETNNHFFPQSLSWSLPSASSQTHGNASTPMGKSDSFAETPARPRGTRGNATPARPRPWAKIKCTEQQGMIPSLIINPSEDFSINVFSSPSTQQTMATSHNWTTTSVGECENIRNPGPHDWLEPTQSLHLIPKTIHNPSRGALLAESGLAVWKSHKVA
jgi:hypothetical protein